MKSISKEQTLTAISDSIAHWKRMIEWAGEQNQEIGKSPLVMLDTIGEDWYSDDGALCSLFDPSGCTGCPLRSCGPSSVWESVIAATTWGEWVVAAKTKMLPALRRAYREVAKKC